VGNRCEEEFVKNGFFLPKEGQLENLVSSYESDVREYLTGLFGEKQQIDFEAFRKFYEMDHTLEVIFYNKRLRMAMTFACLDDIEIIYDSTTSIVQNNNANNVLEVKAV
jgi:hypothetical protein